MRHHVRFHMAIQQQYIVLQNKGDGKHFFSMRNTIKMMRLSKVKYFLYMETELFIHLLNTHAGHNVLLPSLGGQSVYSWDTCLASIPNMAQAYDLLHLVHTLPR